MPFCCIVPGCKTGYRNVGRTTEKKLSLFKPRTMDMLLKWQQVIQRFKGKPLLKSSHVCELHFKEEDIERYYVRGIGLNDKNTCTMLKERPSLKLGAVPCKLLNSDAALENISRSFTSVQQCKIEIQDFTTEEHSLENNNEFNLANFISEVKSLPIHECVLPIQECASMPIVDQFSITQNLHETVTLPTKQWFSQVFSDKIIWAQWGDQCNTAFRVTLLRDMNLQIFIEDRRVYVPGLEKIKTITEMSAVLRRVSTLLPCGGVGIGTEGRTVECSGYVLKSKSGPQTQRCKICTKRRMQVMRKFRNTNTTLKVKCTKRSKKLKNALKHNIRLRAKNKKLQLKIRSLQQLCAKANTEAVEQAITNLPDNQKIAVRACSSASRLKGRKGMRIFECLLLRIKSRNMKKIITNKVKKR